MTVQVVNIVETALNLQNQVSVVASKVIAGVFVDRSSSVDLTVKNPTGPDWKLTVKATKIRGTGKTIGTTARRTTTRGRTAKRTAEKRTARR